MNTNYIYKKTELLKLSLKFKLKPDNIKIYFNCYTCILKNTKKMTNIQTNKTHNKITKTFTNIKMKTGHFCVYIQLKSKVYIHFAESAIC